jgi:glycosyltransferase involved in cell wall biosynthesis
MPRVSVIIPSYNHGRFIDNCIGSIQGQSFSDWELVIVDDGSKDDSVARAKSYAADPRVRVYENEKNLGTYGTLQRALELSTGELIAVMNSDDVWHPQKLARQVQSLDSHPECGLNYVLGWMIDDQGNELEGEDVHEDWPRTETQELLPYLLYENRVLASGVLFRREGLRFETTCRYSGDWIALLERAHDRPVCCIPERMTFWRQHENNTYLRSSKQIAEEIRVRKAIQQSRARWYVSRIPADQISAGLGRNSTNLFVLYLSYKNLWMARKTGIRAFREGPTRRSALKRTVASFLPYRFLRSYLFRGRNAEWLNVNFQEIRKLVDDQAPLEFTGLDAVKP